MKKKQELIYKKLVCKFSCQSITVPFYENSNSALEIFQPFCQISAALTQKSGVTSLYFTKTFSNNACSNKSLTQ